MNPQCHWSASSRNLDLKSRLRIFFFGSRIFLIRDVIDFRDVIENFRLRINKLELDVHIFFSVWIYKL